MKIIRCLIFSSLWFGLPAEADLELIKDCTATQTEEIAAAARYISDNWQAFERSVEKSTPLELKNCLRNRFQKNGKAVCERGGPGSGRCNNTERVANAWASPMNKRVHFCPAFLNIVAKLPRAEDRQACYAALLAHELAHTCDRGERGGEYLDNAAFDFYRAGNTVTIKLTSCATK